MPMPLGARETYMPDTCAGSLLRMPLQDNIVAEAPPGSHAATAASAVPPAGDAGPRDVVPPQEGDSTCFYI